MVAADPLTPERDVRLISAALKNRFSPLIVDRARGTSLFDPQGRRYLDFGPGAAQVNAGYTNEHVQQAVGAQMEKTLFAGMANSIHQPGLDLADRLVQLAPGNFEKKVWFGLTGSEASDALLRLILIATGKPGLISFAGSMHGATETVRSFSGHRAFSRYSSSGHVTKVPYPDPYRNPFGGEVNSVTDDCLGYLEHTVLAILSPPEYTSAIWVETVQGEGGDIVPPPDFLPRLKALCDRYDLLLVIDDIKMGLGRTGKMFSSEHAQVAADAVLLGKALGGGLPISAIVGRREILDAGEGIALFSHAGNATCCAAGLAVLKIMEKERLVERAAENGKYFQKRLTEALGKYDLVGDIRGLGLLQAIDLVKDRRTREPHRSAAARIVYRAWELGLNFYATGNWANVLEFTPSLVISRDEIDEGVNILERAFADVLEDLTDRKET